MRRKMRRRMRRKMVVNHAGWDSQGRDERRGSSSASSPTSHSRHALGSRRRCQHVRRRTAVEIHCL